MLRLFAIVLLFMAIGNIDWSDITDFVTTDTTTTD